MALRLLGSGSGYIELKAPASAGDNTLTLPTNNGTANTFLKTDGSGNLSWQSNLTFDGSTLTVTGAVGISSDLFHIGDDDTKITFTDNQIDLRTGNSSRIYLNNYALYVRSGFPFAFLATSGDSPNIKSGGTNAQDLLLTTGSGNPTRLQVGVGGDVTVNTGNLVIGTAGKGIDFSAQTDTGTGVSNVSEVLDHYEEGTFTLAWAFSTSGSAGMTADRGNYVRVGNIVHVTFEVATSSTSSPSGNITVTGLPFTSYNQGGNYSGAAIGFARDWATDMPNLRINLDPNSSTLKLFKHATNANESSSSVQGSDMASGAAENYIGGSLTYRVA